MAWEILHHIPIVSPMLPSPPWGGDLQHNGSIPMAPFTVTPKLFHSTEIYDMGSHPYVPMSTSWDRDLWHSGSVPTVSPALSHGMGIYGRELRPHGVPKLTPWDGHLWHGGGSHPTGLSSFQQSVAMDRIQRIIGVLQKPEMG